jgi:opacity protein-like surface antigen
MKTTTIVVALFASTLAYAAAATAQQTVVDAIESPRWSYEFRAGEYAPDLDLFETFYGDDREDYYGMAFSYRFDDWLEVGGELSQMRASGVGVLTNSQTLGGSVKYRLNPIQVYSNVIFQRDAMQRVVPYLGLGLTVARYDQEVDLQGSSSGYTDLGYTARAGIRFRIATRQTARSMATSGSSYWRSFIFLEAQHISTEIDDIELGGEAYLLGFRMEFDLNGS